MGNDTTGHDAGPPTAQNPSTVVAAELAEANILIIDDQPADVTLLRQLLASAGYARVDAATDSAAAVDRVQALDPDLIVLDLHMPGVDGFEVMRRITAELHPGQLLPILVLTADVDPAVKHRALGAGATDFLAKPMDHTELLLRVRNLLRTRSLHRELDQQNERLKEHVRERTAHLWEAINRLQATEEELRSSYEETVHRLAAAAEFRDEETGQHIQRMSRYASLLADSAGLSPERCRALQLAATMHDVGKIGVPDGILLKAMRLSAEEFAQVEQHTTIGHGILEGSRSELLRLAATIAWTHHERWDGGGYPRGLSDSDIPLEGRIAAVADVFDALTTDRIYRPAFPLGKAIEMMRAERGAHFDPDLLDLFLASMDEVVTILHDHRDKTTRPEVVPSEAVSLGHA